jgi:histidyl-tRNA synthetase
MTDLPRLPRGFQDREAFDILATHAMIEKIRTVYALYGFDPIETPFVEYTQSLGKFLPDAIDPMRACFLLKMRKRNG